MSTPRRTPRPPLLVGIAAPSVGAEVDRTARALDDALAPGDAVVVLDAAGAVAFNRLATAAADVGAVVLVTAGARPAPDAVEHLARAVARAGVGLAGPSLSRAWNAQAAATVADPADLVGAAAELAARHGDGLRSLAPLHAVADTCLAVAAATLAAVGAADDGFGSGPCWELEYAARAARVGLPAVWVPAAYVESPAALPPRADEAHLLALARRRYQDRLCGLRLDGRRSGYAEHCHGDACEHFAPAGRIVVHLPLPRPRAGPPVPAVTPVPTAGRVARVVTVPPAPAPAPAARRWPVAAGGDAVLATCVMPTADRPEWVAQSIAMFHRQDHPARELVIVDDGATSLATTLGPVLDHPAIVHVRLEHRASIGAKRNLAASRARGSVLVQWDDDDWFGPERLSRQLAPIAAGSAEITGFDDATWFDVEAWRFRRPRRDLHRRLFVEDVHGGTLTFHRDVWDRRGVRYPDASLAEDAAFVRAAVRAGARLARLSAAGVYLYVRHGANSWRPPGAGGDGWEESGEPSALAADRAFYAARSRAAPGRASEPAPVVSCIMPTAGRERFLGGAISSFLAQRGVDAELVVSDDGVDPVGHLVGDDPRVRYLRLTDRRPLGDKRNRTVEAARGEVIVHFDDDDWSHPDRLRVQLDHLRGGSTDVCGLDRLLWWDHDRQAAWRYTCPRLHRPWVAGNTLAYLRSTWERAKFPPQDVGEDTAFVWGLAGRRIGVLADERLVIGRLHRANTSTKHTNSAAWSPVDAGAVRRVLWAAGAEWWAG